MRIELYNCRTLTPEQYHAAVDALWNHFLDVRLDPRDIVIARSDRQDFWHENGRAVDAALLPDAPIADWILSQDQIARDKAQRAANCDQPVQYVLNDMLNGNVEWRNVENRALSCAFDDHCVE